MKNWKRWTHLDSTPASANAKEVLTPMEGDNFIFPIAYGTVKVSGGDQDLRTSPLIRDRTERREFQKFLKEIQMNGKLRLSSSQSLSSSFVLFSSTSPTPGLLSTHPLSHCEMLGRMAFLRNTHLLQVMSSKESSSTSHWYIQLTIRQRALQRHPTRTSKTSNDVGCWLHHNILKYRGDWMQKVYRSEKHIHTEHKLITQNEKAQCQCRLEISKLWRNLLQPKDQDIQRFFKAGRKKWPQNFHVSCVCTSHEENLLGLTAEVQRMTSMTSTWTLPYGLYAWMLRSKLQFILVKMENLRFIKNQLLKSLKEFYSWWMRSWPRIRETFFLRQNNWDYEYQNLRLRGLGAMLGRHQYWIKCYLETRYLKELNRIDGELMEFEWKIFPGFTTLGFLEQIQNFTTELQCELEQFQGRIIFMSMEEQRNTEKCVLQLRIVLANSCPGIGHSRDLDQRRNGTKPTMRSGAENVTQR